MSPYGNISNSHQLIKNAGSGSRKQHRLSLITATLIDMKNRAGESLSRLTDPLIRRNGQLTTTTWDEAFDHASKGLIAALESSGPNSIGLFSCSKSTNEMNYAAQKFMRSVIKSNNIDSCNRT